MKGYAILLIALHNFLHLERHGFVPENEMKYVKDNVVLFFDHLADPSVSLIGDVISFMGWIGVPVFVFLSGYGLSRKYSNAPTIDSRKYIKWSFLKLFLLLLPAIIFYLISYAILQDWGRFGSCLLTTTLLQNVVSNIVPFSPGVYWYFGVTFQFYILFLLIRRRKEKGERRKEKGERRKGPYCLWLDLFPSSTYF